jgi:hypothetical protein
MNHWMKRSIPLLALSALLVATGATLGAQDASQSGSQTSPYQGVSHPPADDVIETSTIPEPKPPAGKPLNAQPTAQPSSVSNQVYSLPGASASMAAGTPRSAQPSSFDPSANLPAAEAVDGTDAGIVRAAPGYAPPPQALNQRTTYAYDPDGDIVHTLPPRPGELQEGTSIRVHLLDRLSTAESEKGEPFRTRVATDVLQGGQVVIPAGAEIDGRVVEVSSGHMGASGTMRLQPDYVILPNGTRFRLYADVTGTPGSHARVMGEGTIKADSRLKKDGIEYGGAVGAGAITGAIVAGPAGALAGTLIGAGAITVHLLVSHPQATLESGTTLMFMLTDPLYLAADTANGN